MEAVNNKMKYVYNVRFYDDNTFKNSYADMYYLNPIDTEWVFDTTNITKVFYIRVPPNSKEYKRAMRNSKMPNKNSKIKQIIDQLESKLEIIYKNRLQAIKEFRKSSDYCNWIKTGAFIHTSFDRFLECNIVSDFVSDRIRKTNNPKAKPIKKTSLLEEFKLWFQQEKGSRKVPKADELCEYMNKKFGAFNPTFKGWSGIEFINDEEEIIDII
jgi:hypothetical protein